MDSLEQIEREIRLCQRCELRAGCSNPVPGFGAEAAKYFLIGEAPGATEDKEGVPFVGSAGRRLDTLLKLAGIDLNDCFLSNVCRCRPPTNRTPRKKEVKACVPFLWREIHLVKPKMLITLGSLSLGLFAPFGITQCHGSMMEVEVPDAI